jgi:hypothetical protein
MKRNYKYEKEMLHWLDGGEIEERYWDGDWAQFDGMWVDSPEWQYRIAEPELCEDEGCITEKPKHQTGVYRITQPLRVGKQAEVVEATYDYDANGFRRPYWINRCGLPVLVMQGLSDEYMHAIREFSMPCSWEFIPEDV